MLIYRQNILKKFLMRCGFGVWFWFFGGTKMEELGVIYCSFLVDFC